MVLEKEPSVVVPVIVACPLLTPEITPCVFTVATFVLFDFHITDLFVAFWGDMV